MRTRSAPRLGTNDPGRGAPLVEGAWYRDRSEFMKPHSFKILKLHEESLLVVDKHGNRRLVNRALFERDMRRDENR